MIKNKSSYKWIFILLLITGCLVIKSFIGFGWDDEGYYLSVVHRYAMGEVPAFDEWYPSSLFGMILLPVYFLHKIVFGSVEGIVVFFRLFHLLIRFISSIFAYAVIRKHTKNDVTAFFAAGCLLVYSKENMALYSYSDLAVNYGCLAVILLLYNETFGEKKKWIYFVAGISYVITVFANPYNIVLYFYFVLLAFVAWKTQKDKSSFSALRLFTAGCCLIGFSFIVYLLLNEPATALMHSLKYVLNFPGLVAKNVIVALIKWGWYVVKPYGIILLILQIAIFTYTMVRTYKKNWKWQHKCILFFTELVCAFIYILIQFFFLDDKSVIGIAYIPISILGLLCFMMTEEKDWPPFLLVYIPGILMSMTFQCSSLTGIFAITTGFTLSVIASFILIYRFVQETGEKKIRSCTNIFLGVVLGYTFAIRILYCRYNVYEEVYNCHIENGAYKGIITDTSQKEFYEQSMTELYMIEGLTEEGDSVLILGNNMWMYLCLERGVGAPTTWRMEANHIYFSPYYDMHPDKMPACIYTNELCEEEYGDSILLNGVTYKELYSGRGKIYVAE